MIGNEVIAQGGPCPPGYEHQQNACVKSTQPQFVCPGGTTPVPGDPSLCQSTTTTQATCADLISNDQRNPTQTGNQCTYTFQNNAQRNQQACASQGGTYDQQSRTCTYPANQCPQGGEFNPATGQCTVTQTVTATVTCPQGGSFNPSTGFCEDVIKVGGGGG